MEKVEESIYASTFNRPNLTSKMLTFPLPLINHSHPFLFSSHLPQLLFYSQLQLVYQTHRSLLPTSPTQRNLLTPSSKADSTDQQMPGVSSQEQLPSSSATVSQPSAAGVAQPSSTTSSTVMVNHALKPTNEIIKEVLAIPIPQMQRKKQTKRAQGTAHLPKHLSGEQVVQMLEERCCAEESDGFWYTSCSWL